MMSTNPEGIKQDVINKVNLLDFDQAGLQAYFTEMGEKPFRGTQVFQWIHQHGVIDVTQMSNLSKLCQQRLLEEASFDVPEIAHDQQSVDGTRKWLMRLADGNNIETVFIPEDDRGTLCISSHKWVAPSIVHFAPLVPWVLIAI
jgi:23S rRNA (adenine2503-C2)-methyltransferase